MRCVLATRNEHKRDEIEAIFAAAGLDHVELVTLREYPHVPSPIEDGATFLENARKKALHAARHTGEWALADDSGLVVDALDGAPGIHSARYAGEDATDADRIRKLLDALRDVPEDHRTARFVCALVLARGDRVVAETEGVCEGRIAFAPSGTGGFGYDPIFYLPEHGKTMAEIGADEKNRISHRARAVFALRDALRDAFRS